MQILNPSFINKKSKNNFSKIAAKKKFFIVFSNLVFHFAHFNITNTIQHFFASNNPKSYFVLIPHNPIFAA